jgi:hypothetical protein
MVDRSGFCAANFNGILEFLFFFVGLAGQEALLAGILLIEVSVWFLLVFRFNWVF